ncbi:MAG: ribosome maturation factor RimP [Actinomycetaceae bacterium]|nr:ribosome maturation factor RimP [Actinomycetaceae bacterium]
MSKAVEARIQELVAPIVKSADLFLESVTVTTGRDPLVRVTVDLYEGEGAVDADNLQELTRQISTALDEADPIENAYMLEVSTPGAERQLTTPRHFSRTTGHLVEIKTKTGERIKGRVISSDENSVTVEVTGKKGKPSEELAIPLDNISKARSRVDFGAIGK